MSYEDLPTGWVPEVLKSGQKLGKRYEIVREIGRGGMGVAYLARDLDLDLEVVLKVLPPELATNRRAMEELKREASVAIRLSHPNIVRVYNTDEIDGTRFVAMEYVDGETLAARLDREGPFSEGEFLKIAIPVCDALAHAHSHKVIHRDLKPANIMVSRDGVVKVMDFGIARVVKDSTTKLTGKVTAGTLLYMSPEQVLGRPVDKRSDIYSLGATFYELLTGDPPFTQGDITYQILNEKPAPLGRENLSPSCEAAITKLLEKRPERRFASAVELKVALETRRSAISPQPSAPSPSPLPLAGEGGRRPGEGVAPGSTPSEKPSGVKPNATVRWAIVGVLALLFLTALGYYVWTRSPKNILRQQELYQDTEAGKSADDFFKLAYDQSSKGDYDNAVRNYSAAIQMRPDFADAYYNRGHIFTMEKHDDFRAMEDFNKVIQLRPDNAMAYWFRGSIRHGRGDYDQAIEDFGRVIQLKPDFTMALHDRGVAWASKGDLDRAREDWRKGCDLNDGMSCNEMKKLQ